MKKNNLLLIGAAVLILTGGFYSGRIFHPFSSSSKSGKAIYYCPMHPTYTSERPGTCPICSMNLVKREAAEMTSVPPQAAASAGEPRVYTVEQLMKMKPGEICLLHKCKMGQCMIAMTEEFARLGKCPHCGEDLGIIVKDAVPGGYAKVNLSEDRKLLAGIKTSTAAKKKLVKTIRTSGRIASDPELYQAEQEFIQSLQAMKKAAASTEAEIVQQSSKLVDSARLKLKLMGLSDELVKELETSDQPDRSLLYTDAGGKAWLYAPIYEYEIPLVKTGQSVSVNVPAFPDKSFGGIIRSIDPVLDPVTRSVRIRAQLENPDGFLKPEMYVNATVNIEIGEVLSVPEEAVFVTGDKNIVFVAGENGVFEPREVILGAKTEDDYEVKSGLAEGEKIVTSGNFLIDSESRLKAALENIGSGGGGHHHGA